jgi:hypothetical protein
MRNALLPILPDSYFDYLRNNCITRNLEADTEYSARGVEIYQFDRDYREGSYRMLHMAMRVRRQSPPKKRRGPGRPIPNNAAIAQKTAIRKLFEGMVGAVEEIVAGKPQAELQADLNRLFAHRRRYYEPPLHRSSGRNQ